MQTINFFAKNRNRNVTGTLILRNGVNRIMFDTSGQAALEGFVDSDLEVKDIKDPNNFIASFFARVDKEGVFNKVTVGESVITIKRTQEQEDSIPVEAFVLGELEDKKVFVEQDFTLIDKNGKVVTMKLSDHFKTVRVPLGFRYVKDNLLNAILAYNVVPFDYDRQWNNKILKIIKQNQDVLKGQEPRNVYINKFMQVQNKKTSSTILVVPHELFK